MVETRTLIDHEEIRDWAAARMGVPAFGDPPTSEDVDPELLILFGQVAYEDEDYGADRPISEAPELVDWDDWFKLFDKHSLALVVAKEEPGRIDQFHELIRR
ncbi:MAG TPA: hypothetical protein VHC00_19050 [Rhizobiaceae bacterium]|nr:hypothetical protein [Rhizobiaceae bacterium]